MAVNIMCWRWITTKFHNFSRILILTIVFAHYCACQDDDLTDAACGDNQPALVTSSGTHITSPMYPNDTYMLSQECTWLARAKPGQVIRLTFTIFDLEDVYPCWFAFVHVYDGSIIDEDESIQNFCGRTLPEVTHTGTHEMFIHYLTLDKGEGEGFNVIVDFIDINAIACGSESPAVISWKQGGFVSPEWPDDYPTGVQCSWRIETSLDLRLEFVDWNLRPPSETGCTDHVTMYDGPTITHPLIATYCGTDYPDVTSMTSHALLVVFESHNYYYDYDGMFRIGFSNRNVTEVGCGEERNIDIDWSPGFIQGPLTNESHCRWNFYAPEGKVIRFEIEYFDLPPCANCGCSKVSIYNGEHFDDSALIGSYCEGGWTEDFIQSGGNKAGMTYDSYRLNPGTGFSIKYSFYDFSDHACSSDRPINLTHDHGIITSPLYDKGYYPNDLDCHWSIHTSLGKVIEFHFLTFAVQSCISCTCDILYIYNGPTPDSDLEVRRLCDTYKPNLFLTTLPGAYLMFLTDDSASPHQGFKIEYEIINVADKACGDQQPIELTLSPGDILSPNYGSGDYPQHINCQWLITTVFEKTMKLEFLVFDVEYDEPHRCQFDWVKVYDGETTGSPLMGKYCGSQLPATLTGTSRAMLIEFVANHYIEGDGFHLRFEETDPLPAANMTAVIIPAVVCGALAAATLIAVTVVYCKRYQKKRRTRRASLPPLRTPLNLESILRSRPPTSRPASARPPSSRSSRPPRPEVSEVSSVDHLYDQVDQANIFSWSESGMGTDNYSMMPAPPSYQESRDQQGRGASLDCPPPTYEESLGHRLARDRHATIIETSFMENTVSVHHSVADTDTDSDSTIVTFNPNTRALERSRYSDAINNDFEDEDGLEPMELNVSRLSRRHRIGSRSRSLADPGLDRTRDSMKSRTRAQTTDNPLNVTRGSIQTVPSSLQNDDSRKHQKTFQQQLKSSGFDHNHALLRRKIANKTASEKLRLSKSYDDILGSKAFNISMTNLDQVESDVGGNSAGTSSGQYNDPGEGTLRRRARSETHLLSRLPSNDGEGAAQRGFTLRRQSESEARETII